MFSTDFPRLSGNQRGFLLITLAMFGFTGMNAFIKALGTLDTLQIMFLRGIGSALMLWGCALCVGVRRTLATRRVSLHGMRALLGALAGCAWVYATHRLSLALVTVLALATPLWMLPLGRLLLGERSSAARWLGVFVGFAGVWVMADPSGSPATLPCLIALAAALLDALLGVLLKQATTTETPTGIQFWNMLGQTLVFAGLGGAALPSAALWPAVAGMVGLSVLCGWLFALGYRAGDVSAVEPGSFNALPLAALVGYWQFGEVPGMAFWWGSGLLLIGVLMVLFGPSAPAFSSEAADA